MVRVRTTLQLCHAVTDAAGITVIQMIDRSIGRRSITRRVYIISYMCLIYGGGSYNCNRMYVYGMKKKDNRSSTFICNVKNKTGADLYFVFFAKK